MRSLFALFAAVLLVVGGPALGLAQEASPVAEEGMPQGPPEGVAFAVLAQAVVEDLPPGPTEIGFVRLTVAPGTTVPIEAEPGLAFVVVGSGTFTATLSSAVEVSRVEVAGTPVAARISSANMAFPLAAGESAIFPPFATGEVRNDGAEPVTVLAMFIGPPAEAMATPMAGATPMAEDETPEGLTFEPLSFGLAEELPAGPAALVMARVTIAPGATIPEHPQLGAEAGHVEAGPFTFRTVAGPEIQVVRGVAELAAPDAVPTMEAAGAGQEVTVSVGDAFFIPIGTVFSGEASGETEAVALIAVVEPLGEMAATPAP